MTNYRKIVVPLDGSELAEQVLPWASLLARSLGTRMHLLRSYEPIDVSLRDLVDTDSYARASAEEIAEATTYLDGVAGRLRGEGLDVSHEVREGVAAWSIINVAEAEAATMVAMSTRGRSGFTRWALGSVADKVVQACLQPVLVYRPEEPERGNRRVAVSEVIVPLDGTDVSARSIPIGKAMAKALGANLLLVYTIDAANGSEWDKKVEAAAESYLAHRAKEAAPDVAKVDTRILRGDPASAIASLLESDDDNMAVMATQSRASVGRAVMGSVTDRVIRTSGSPVLVTRVS